MHIVTQRFTKLTGRRSIRIRNFDYSNGAYFVTLCTHNRTCLFGNVVSSNMELNSIGKIVQHCWKNLPVLYPYVELGEWIVMPNHLHGILVLGPSDDISPSVSSKQKTLGSLIGAFKTISSKQIKSMISRNPGTQIWQRNYYEHIIRGDRTYKLIRQYILDNPTQWDLDPENPNRSGALQSFSTRGQ